MSKMTFPQLQNIMNFSDEDIEIIYNEYMSTDKYRKDLLITKPLVLFSSVSLRKKIVCAMIIVVEKDFSVEFSNKEIITLSSLINNSLDEPDIVRSLENMDYEIALERTYQLSVEVFHDQITQWGIEEVISSIKCCFIEIIKYVNFANDRENGLLLDPILSCSIIGEKIVCGSYCYSPDSIVDYYIRNENPKNIETKAVFTEKEINHILKQVEKKCNIRVTDVKEIRLWFQFIRDSKSQCVDPEMFAYTKIVRRVLEYNADPEIFCNISPVLEKLKSEASKFICERAKSGFYMDK